MFCRVCGAAGTRRRGARACLVSRTHGCFVSCVQARTVLRGANRCCPGAQNKQSPSKRASGRCASTKKYQVPGARTGVLFFHARRQQAPGARGTSTVVFFVFRAGSRTEHGRVLCFLFSSRACMHLAASTSFRARTRLCPFARAGTWHEHGCVCVLGSVSSCARRRPGTNTLVSRRGVAFCLRVRARAELFFVRAATNTCACFRVRSCVPIPRGQHEHNMFVVLRACGRQAPGVKPP